MSRVNTTDSASLRERAYSHVLSGLFAGAYKPGRKIAELTLSRELKMSRAPIREALGQLAAERLITNVPGRGSFVRVPDRRELAELFDMRECLECYGIAKAARRIKSSELLKLRETCDGMSVTLRAVKASGGALSDDAAAHFIRADVAFHMLISAASRNRELYEAMGKLQLLGRSWTRQPDFVGPGLLTVLVRAYRFHRRILAALRRRDAKLARRVMREHIRESKQRFLKQLGSKTARPWPSSVLDILG